MKYQNFLQYTREFFFKKNNKPNLDFTESDPWYKLFESGSLPKNYYSTYNVSYKSDKLYLTFGDQIFLKYFINIPKGEYDVTYFAVSEFDPYVIRFNLKSNPNQVIKEKTIFDAANVDGYCAVIDSSDIKAISNDSSSIVTKDKIVWDKLESIIDDDEEIFDVEAMKKISPANTPILIFQFDENDPEVVVGYDSSNKITEFYLVGGSKSEIISELS